MRDSFLFLDSDFGKTHRLFARSTWRPSTRRDSWGRQPVSQVTTIKSRRWSSCTTERMPAVLRRRDDDLAMFGSRNFDLRDRIAQITLTHRPGKQRLIVRR